MRHKTWDPCVVTPFGVRFPLCLSVYLLLDYSRPLLTLPLCPFTHPFPTISCVLPLASSETRYVSFTETYHLLPPGPHPRQVRLPSPPHPLMYVHTVRFVPPVSPTSSAHSLSPSSTHSLSRPRSDHPRVPVTSSDQFDRRFTLVLPIR